MIYLRLFVPGRIVSWNTFYSGKHWTHRKRLRDEWHMRVLAALREVGDVPTLGRAYIGVMAHIKGRAHVPDTSNVWFKAVEDVLVDQGVLPDDNPDHVLGVFVTVEIDSGRDGLEVILGDDIFEIASILTGH